MSIKTIKHQLNLLRKKLKNTTSESEIQNIKNNIDKLKQQLTKAEIQNQASKRWRENNKDYFKNYYKNHSEQMIANVIKYKHTEKGRASIIKYESKPETKAKRKLYQIKRKKRMLN